MVKKNIFEAGQGGIEYVLLLAFISVIAFGILGSLGEEVNNQFRVVIDEARESQNGQQLDEEPDTGENPCEGEDCENNDEQGDDSESDQEDENSDEQDDEQNDTGGEGGDENTDGEEEGDENADGEEDEETEEKNEELEEQNSPHIQLSVRRFKKKVKLTIKLTEGKTRISIYDSQSGTMLITNKKCGSKKKNYCTINLKVGSGSGSLVVSTSKFGGAGSLIYYPEK